MPRIGGFLAVVLLAVALVYLQVSNSETALLTAFPAYGLIALTALIVVAISRSQSDIDLPCLYTTGAFVAYIIIRAWTSPAPYAARSDLYLVLAAAVVYGLT
ncbi:MAG: hypothetical protein M3Y03_00425, partial [Verrucomicrobiota bacterium]|nr:hypothetical protein [Verrucomicrobiota bacterium]